MKRTKRFLSLILSMILLLTMAMPVMAAQHDDVHSHHTITINETDAGHVFEAYQIFGGDVAVKAGNIVLSNPVWGTGVDTVKTVEWTVNGSKVSLNLEQALKTEGVNPDYNLYAQAKNVAEIVNALAKNNSTEHAEVFARIVGEYLTSISDNIKTSKAYTHSKDADGNALYDANGNPIYVETPTDGTITNYQIRDLSDGYYLVKEDKNTNLPSVTHTDYILKIVQDVTVTPKDGEVSVDKDIIEGTTPVDACANNIGDVIEFKITGMLPSNYDEYETYYYSFVDTMSQGLTLDATQIEVFTLNGDDDKEIPSTYYDVSISTVNNETKLQITFDNLKELTVADGYTVESTTKIIVTYKATLNEKAVTGGNGNPNTVHLEFDRSPYDEGHGTTPDNTVYVFTFKLHVLKFDGNNTQIETDDDPLDGATFILARERSGHPQYAVVANDAVSKWTSWTSEEDLKEYIDTTYKNENDQFKEDLYNELLTTYGVATEFVSKNGVFDIIGLDLDTYWLIETAAPAGYNLADPVKFVINASYDKTLNRPPKEGQTESKDTLTITIGNEVFDGDTTAGAVQARVVNNPGSQLPSTGGIGTTIFYVLGGCLVVAAVVLLITKKRMSNE